MSRVKGSPREPGSGRKKGTPNKNAVPLKEKAEALGVDPFEILLLFAKGDWKELGYPAAMVVKYSQHCQNEEFTIPPATRAKAAAEASQYLYPKLKAVEHSGKIEGDANKVSVTLTLPKNGSEAETEADDE